MTISHKEALKACGDLMPAECPRDEDLDMFLRAYLDARGLVMVPKGGCDEMREAASKAQGESDMAALRWEAPDDEVFSIVLAAISAAPDPFGGE